MSAAAPKELNTYRKYWASRFGTAPFLILGPPFEPVLRGIGVLIVFWLILYWMYRRKIFLRI